MRKWTQLTQLFFFTTDVHTFCQLSQLSVSWWTRKDWLKRSCGLPHVFLPSNVIFSQWKGFWLIQRINRSEEDTIGFLNHLSFLELHCFLSVFEASSGFSGKGGPSAPSVSPFGYSVTHASLWICFETCCPSTFHGFPRFCAYRTLWVLHASRVTRRNEC